MTHATHPVVFLSILCFLGAASTCQAQSLWKRHDPERVFLFHDTGARRIGDLLTVLIRENTDVDNRDERALEKTGAHSAGFSLVGAATGVVGSASGDGKLDAEKHSSHKFDGSSGLTMERDFSDRLTVSVVDLLPNGNMVIRGKRRLFVAGEERILVLSGILRPHDIRPDNTVESRYIGNFEIHYEGDGDESRFTNRGWLTRHLHNLWPF